MMSMYICYHAGMQLHQTEGIYFLLENVEYSISVLFSRCQRLVQSSTQEQVSSLNFSD
jgi:hypothetical protein